MSLTPQERTLRAKLAAHTLHAHLEDPVAHTRPAREAFERKFLDEVDPDRLLPEAERQRRAEHARKAHYLRLAALGVKARAARKKGKKCPPVP